MRANIASQAFVAVLRAARSSRGAIVNFTPSDPRMDASDVLHGGGTRLAISFANPAGPSVTLNGVVFQQTAASDAAGLYSLSPSAGLRVTNVFGSSEGWFMKLPAECRAILRGAIFDASAPTTTLSLDLLGLTVGERYLVQLWVNNSRGEGSAATPLFPEVGPRWTCLTRSRKRWVNLAGLRWVCLRRTRPRSRTR